MTVLLTEPHPNLWKLLATPTWQPEARFQYAHLPTLQRAEAVGV